MTIVLGAVGAGIGFFSGGGPAGARLGWSIGTVVGSFLDMPRMPKVETGKLDDLRFTSSAPGAPVAHVWGTARIGGHVIWADLNEDGEHLVERKRKKSVGSGKNKQKVTEHYYTSTFAVAFCVGTQWMPDDSTVYRAPVIQRLWADDVLIYDADAVENVIVPTLYSGSESQSPDPVVIAGEDVSSGDAPAFRGLCYAVFEDMNLEDFGSRIPNFSAEIATDPVTLSNVVSDLCRSVGLATSDLEFTAATDTVTGFVALSRGAPQDAIQSLLTAYNYDLVEVDGKLKLVPRGGSATFALTADDLGAQIGEDGAEPYTRRRSMKIDRPGRVDVRYFDKDADHQQAIETEWRQASDVSNVMTFDLPISAASDFARGIAARELDRASFEDQTFDTSVLHRLSSIAPGDVGTIATRTGTKRVRVVRAATALAGEVRLTLVPDDVAFGTQNTGGTGGGGSGGGGVEQIVPTAFEAWSGRELYDAHEATPGFYVFASGDSGWRGCQVFYSLDGGTSWLQGSFITGRCVFGETESVLADA